MQFKELRIRVPWPRIQGGAHWKRFLPTPGNAIFTLAMISLLVAAQSVGALPLGRSQAAPSAASTSTIAYQGRLADSAGAPLTGTYNMLFRLYDAAASGTPLWEEQWTGSNGVRVSDGLFNVMLGSLTAIPQSIIAGHDQLLLGITIGTDDEMAPRVQLGSVPYALQALTVPDESVTTAKIADGAVTPAKLAPSSIPKVVSTGDLYYTGVYTMTGWANYHDILETALTITVSERSAIVISASADVVVNSGSGWLYASIWRDHTTGVVLDRHSPAVESWSQWAWSGLDTVEPGTYTYSLNTMGSAGWSLRWYNPNLTLTVIPLGLP